MSWYYNPFTGNLDYYKDYTEVLAHADLSDMPDTGGTVSDHDARYYKSGDSPSFGSITLTDDTSVISSANAIDIRPSGDTDDYLQFLTSGNTPYIRRVGGGEVILSTDGSFIQLTLYESTTSESYLQHTNSTDDLIIQAQDKINLRANEEIDLRPSGDSDDYIALQTVGGVPEITTVGACDLKITSSSGEIDFDNENLTTAGNLTLSKVLIDITDAEALLVRKNGDTGDILTVDTTNSVVEIGGSGRSIFNEGAVINEGANDSDFRVESQSNIEMLWVDASTNRVGVGTGALDRTLHIQESNTSNASCGFKIENTSTNVGADAVCQFRVVSQDFIMGIDSTDDDFKIGEATTLGTSVRLTIADGTGDITIAQDLTVSGDLTVGKITSTASGYLSITTTASSTATALEFDVFDEDNYATYTFDSNVTADGITYTQANGRFTANSDGIYLITVTFILNISSSGLVVLAVKDNGAAFYSHDFYIHSAVDPVIRSISVIRGLSNNDYINVTLDSSGAGTLSAYDGTTMTISKMK